MFSVGAGTRLWPPMPPMPIPAMFSFSLGAVLPSRPSTPAGTIEKRAAAPAALHK